MFSTLEDEGDDDGHHRLPSPRVPLLEAWLRRRLTGGECHPLFLAILFENTLTLLL